MGNSQSTPAAAPAPVAAAPAANSQAENKPKPCCVCKEEKAKRDDCMLFSTASDPQKDCQSTIEAYRACMAGYGFKV